MPTGSKACNKRYVGFVKIHARAGGQGQIIGGTLDASNYLVSFDDLKEAQESLEAYLCRSGYGNTTSYRAYILDQQTHEIAAHMGVDPMPSAPWVNKAKS